MAATEKLEQIETGLATFKEASKKNAQLTSHLVGILDSFEKKIGRLEDTYFGNNNYDMSDSSAFEAASSRSKVKQQSLPVYQQTELLRLKQQNLDKTLKLLDEVVGYYNVSREVDVLIQNGPNSTSLEEYLNAINRVENAAKYFEKNNSQSVELENLLSLYNIGVDALKKEFRDVLTKYSKVLPSVVILEMIEEDYSAQQNSSMSIPDHVQGDLKKLAEWLMYHNEDAYMNIYASLRSNVLLRSIQGLKDYQKANSLTMASPSSVLVSPSPSTPSVMKTKIRFPKKATKMLQKYTSAAVDFGNKKSAEVKEGDSVTDRESENFLILASGMLKLMQIESNLMLGVIPMQHKQKIFEIISRDSFDLLFSDGENIAGRIKRTINRHEYTAILTVFPIIKCLQQNIQPGFELIFVGSLTKANKLTTLLKTFQTNGMRAMEDFIENIRNEQTSQLPKDGTVHELTSNVLMFLEHLTEYIDPASAILQMDPTYSSSVHMGPNKILDEHQKRSLLGSYFKRVLHELNLTLVTCSDLYYDNSIKAIFRLNNANYIIKCLQGSILLDLLQTKEPDCKQNYFDMMEDQKNYYLIATWKKLEVRLFHTDDIPISLLQAGKLRDKDRQIIKDKFSSFNKEFEEISRLQQSYSVPDPELRSTLKRASRDYIYSKYREFYDKYANVPFTKNTEKYIKFTPQQIIVMIENFFDVS